MYSTEDVQKIRANSKGLKNVIDVEDLQNKNFKKKCVIVKGVEVWVGAW